MRGSVGTHLPHKPGLPGLISGTHDKRREQPPTPIKRSCPLSSTGAPLPVAHIRAFISMHISVGTYTRMTGGHFGNIYFGT